MSQTQQSVWKNHNFVKFWLAHTISRTGNGITGIALPLTAILLLSANSVQIGVLAALDGLAVLIFGLVAGLLVDRFQRRSILVATDIARAVLLASIPIAAILKLLSIVHLYLVVTLVSILTVFFNAADDAFLPELVQPHELIEGNSKLGMSDAIAEIIGPAIAGELVQILSAPLTIILDAFSFLGSAFCVLRISKPELPLSHGKYPSMWHEATHGLLLVMRNPPLRVLAGSAALFNFTGMFIGTLYTLYVVRVQHLSPFILGLLVASGGLSAFIGAGVAERIARRIGIGLSIGGALFLYGVTGLLTPLAFGPLNVVLFMLFSSQCLGDIFVSIYAISEISLRQSLVPNHLLGRVNATIQFLTQATLPVSALLAGLLAQYLGIRVTILIGVIGVITAGLWLLLSPVRQIKTLQMLE